MILGFLNNIRRRQSTTTNQQITTLRFAMLGVTGHTKLKGMELHEQNDIHFIQKQTKS